ncbi:MauE/DoxX family redox-associated membrane protein [Bradyrhizobium sp. Ai1a-2]|uniref:MauE/DoxX family redox-associated membrane protein n=1 Tax=Bradyrhizobium sp. Ai1a-2 TaxID=196490 RepID=UPI00041EB3F9|nr:MauE/DoxX family redox-associated membrane protein [Bradyrhizobium sp. Ai1a-2]
MNWQLDPLLQLVATGFVIMVLARAVVEKLSAYGIFVANLRDYRLLPDALAPVAAPTLLAAELSATLCLLLPATSAVGAVIAASLFAVYALAMAAVLLAGRHEIECGCGGEGQMVSGALVARNGVLVAISASILLPASNRAMSWSDTLVGLVAIFLVFLLLAIAEKTIGTFTTIRRLDSGSQ